MNPWRFFLLLFVACGIGAFYVDVDEVAGGGTTLGGWLLAMTGLCFLPLAWRREWGLKASLWSVLFLGASCAWLALTRPLWLHEFLIRPHNLESWGSRLALAVVSLQLLLVCGGLWRMRGELKGVLRFALAPRAILVVGLCLVFGSAHFTLLYPHLSKTSFQVHFVVQLILALAMGATSLGNLILLYRVLDSNWTSRCVAGLSSRLSLPWSESKGSWDERFPYMLALVTLLVTGALAIFVFDRLPHIPDGVAYLFQARSIANGAFAFSDFPVPESFRHYLIDHRDGLAFSITHPGWPMVLALGDVIGLAWLVNPILSALTVLFGHKWIQRMCSPGWANLISCLLLSSPWFLFLGASHMTHMATAFFFVVGNLAVWTARTQRRADRAFFGGLCLGMVLLIRPLDGLLLGGATGLSLLIRSWNDARLRIKLPLAFSVGAILVASILLAFNNSLTGDYFSTPTNTYIAELWPGSTNRLGFGPEVGNPPEKWGLLDPIVGHGWRDVALNSNQNIANMNVELFGWTTGSLFLLLLFFLMVKQRSALDRAAIAAIVVMALSYNLYWFSGGPDFGPRYWFSMLFPILWLSARGLGALVERLKTSDETASGRICGLALILVIAGLGVFGSWRSVSRYHNYRGFHSDYRQMKEAGSFGRAVVFVDTPSETDFGCAFLLNELPFTTSSPVFVRDLGMPANAKVMSAFPGRPAVFVDGRAKTGYKAKIRLR
ncbi:MAG: hypothetical protein ACI97A_000978 [Planctomycetota bacterium]|jgi:hypothetical protein